MPAFNYHLAEEDQLDGVELLLLLQVVLVGLLLVEVEVAFGLQLLQGLFGLLVHLLEHLFLLQVGGIEELTGDGQLGEVVEGLVVPQVHPVL